MTPQELKTSILQRAIQGRLVEQLPTETLSESIAANALDRNREDIPFEIPDTWCWCYLEDIATLHNGRAYKKPEMLKNGKYPLLRVGNLFTSDTWYYSDMELEPEKYCDNGDLLYAWSASFGPHIWNGGKVIYHYHIWKVELRHPQMRDYLYWALAAQTDAIKRRGHGLTMIHITKAGTEKMLIPVPPIAEQIRIVAKIEELLPLIDRYEQAWSKLEEFNKRFPVAMQKSILQMAIQGKLIPQRPEEGTGEELFQQIQAEKQRLIKEGKIKKEKDLPEIAEDEIPFDIPGSWKWVRFLSVVEIATNLVQPSDYLNYMHIAPDNIEKATGRLLECHTVREDKVASANHLFYNGQILYSKIRPLLRKAAIAPFDGLCSADMYPLNTDLDTKYVLYYLLSDAYNIQIAEAMSSRVKMPKINQNELSKVLIPLPPLGEQKRIVAKLEEILPLCERLK